MFSRTAVVYRCRAASICPVFRSNQPPTRRDSPAFLVNTSPHQHQFAPDTSPPLRKKYPIGNHWDRKNFLNTPNPPTWLNHCMGTGASALSSVPPHPPCAWQSQMLISLSVQPMRVLTVTGTSTAFTTERTIASAVSGSRSKEDPPPF